jgi:hypothetical protein
LAQTRKQKVLQQVQRQRRQRTIITLTIVIVLIAIIVGVVLFYPRAPLEPVQLPAYLDHCVSSALVYHSHPELAITINGVAQVIPITFETGYDAGCSRVIHTHDSTGVLHVGPLGRQHDDNNFQLNPDIQQQSRRWDRAQPEHDRQWER